jgi:hypothetical protein
MTYSFGSFARLMSARSQSRPLRSIFAHSSGVSRMARCTCCSSGGFGGLPRGRFSCSMVRTVAPIYRDANNPCNSDLLGYDKGMNKPRKLTGRQFFVLMEMRRNPCALESFSTSYRATRWSLQEKGMLVFNEQRGRYELTPQGVAAADAERARRSQA